MTEKAVRDENKEALVRLAVQLQAVTHAPSYSTTYRCTALTQHTRGKLFF